MLLAVILLASKTLRETPNGKACLKKIASDTPYVFQLECFFLFVTSKLLTEWTDFDDNGFNLKAGVSHMVASQFGRVL